MEPAVSEPTARRAAELRRRFRVGSAVDALVVAIPEPGGTVLARDRVDIEALAVHADAVAAEPECTATWEGQAEAAREAAESNGAVFVLFLDLFNGRDHDEDARAKGWIDGDGMHSNEEGGAAAAAALAAVGFEPNGQPG